VGPTYLGLRQEAVIGRGREAHRRDWEDLGRLDPFWAILTHPGRRHGGWTAEAFLRTGEAEARWAIELARSVGYPLRYDRLLDVGCGLGRVTRALAAYFREAQGCDISAPMVDGAQMLNDDVANCTFSLVDGSDLRAYEDGSFDMVYCRLVLQHLPGRGAIREHIGELVRVLRDGGLLMFQLPSQLSARRQLQPRRRAYAVLRGLGVDPAVLDHRLGLNPIRTTGLPADEVRALISRAGGLLLRDEPDPASGHGIDSRLYLVTRRAPAPSGS
jgi:SAM-dependent methyltransferase